MNTNWLSWVSRLSVGAIVAAVALATTATPTYALVPFSDFSCPGATQQVAGLTTVPPSSATNVNVQAGYRLEVRVNNGASGTIEIAGGAVILDVANARSGFIFGPWTGTLVTPDIGGGGGLFATGAGNMSINFSCDRVAGPPPPETPLPPPTTTPPTTVSDTVIGALVTTNRNPELANDIFEALLISLPPRGNCPPPPTSVEEFRTRYANLAHATENPSALTQAGQRCEMQTLLSSPFFAEENARLRAAGLPLLYVAQPEASVAAPAAAISQFLMLGSGALGADVSVKSGIPGWTITFSGDGAVIDRSFAALSQHSMIGTVTATGIHPLDDRTVIAVGVKASGTRTTMTSPTAEMSAVTVGLDAAVLRLLGDSLYGGLYGGYEYSAHSGTIAGVVNNFGDHNFKLGGRLQGSVDLASITVTPSASVLLQSHHTPAYTNGANVVIPGMQFFEANGRVGVSFSKDIPLLERMAILTPYAGGNLVFDYNPVASNGTGWFRGELMAGIRVTRPGGTSFVVEGDVSYGTKIVVYGVNGTVSVPLN